MRRSVWALALVCGWSLGCSGYFDLGEITDSVTPDGEEAAEDEATADEDAEEEGEEDDEDGEEEAPEGFEAWSGAWSVDNMSEEEATLWGYRERLLGKHDPKRKPPKKLPDHLRPMWEELTDNPNAKANWEEQVEAVNKHLEVRIVMDEGELYVYQLMEGAEPEEEDCNAVRQIKELTEDTLVTEAHEDTCAPCAGETFTMDGEYLVMTREVCGTGPDMSLLRFGKKE